MNRFTLRTIIILAAISLIGIIATQIYWVKKAYSIEEKQFNERVHLALVNVAQQILDVNKDPSELYDPVDQVSSNYFIVSMNDTLHPYLLESFLKSEFQLRNIQLDFEYVIYDCFTDSVVFGNFVQVKTEEKEEIVEFTSGSQWDRSGHYFGVYFPGKAAFLIKGMDFWIYTSILILFVVVFFAYSVNVMLKQKRLSEIKNDFINNMTHEFKTPISTINLSADVLLGDEISSQPDRLKSYANIIKSENQRLKTQVEKVLQSALLDKSGLELEPQKFDLTELIENTIKSFNLIIEEKKGNISFQKSENEIYVKADKTHLGNIISNLIDNAIKYNTNPPKIEIKLEQQKNGIVFTVTDNGIGISKKSQKLIFEKFYRVPTGNVHDVKGFGLGLNYVKTVVEAHKGKIKVNSEPNKGSEFIIWLPTK
jgi:two-component system phosphate regulon sensor histidine kinase PhoR